MYVIGANLSTFASFILITRFILKSMDKIAINQSNTIDDREKMLANRDWRVGAAALVNSMLMQFNFFLNFHIDAVSR